MDDHKFASNEEFDEFYEGDEDVALLKYRLYKELKASGHDVSKGRILSIARKIVEDKVAEMIKGEG